MKFNKYLEFSPVKGIGCAFRGLGFEFQHPRGNSQVPITNSRGSSTLIWPRWVLLKNIYIHKNYK